MKYSYQPGDQPLDGYTIRKPLGHGGFGEVYQGVSEAGKEVALKLVLRHLDVELRGVTYCLNLKHPNLVSIYDLRSNAAEEHWIVMEYVEGPTLAQLLARHADGLPHDDVLCWLEGIVAGVGYLHEMALVHRDLKPGNIFLEGDTVKVIDYGLSKFITVSHRSGQTQSVGTLHYMAPEIGSGRYGPEVDVYSLGVMLYEMLTGGVPFDGETPAEILMKHLSAEPELSRLPEPFKPVVGRMLAKRPEERYGSVKEVLADVRRYLSDPALAVTTLNQVASSEARLDGREESTLMSQEPRIENSDEVTLPQRDVGTLTRLLPSPSTCRRWSESLREHPILWTICSTLTLLFVITIYSLMDGGVKVLQNPTALTVPTLAAIALGLLFSAYIFLWRAISPTERMLAESRSREQRPRRQPEPLKDLPTPLPAIESLVLAILVGVAVGLATGGTVYGLQVRLETSMMLGLAAGFLAIVLTAYVTLTPFSARFRWRGLIGLFAINIVVLLIFISVLSDKSTHQELAMINCGIGAGLLTVALLASLLRSHKRFHR